MTTTYSYNKRFAAHLGETGGIVFIPDQIAEDQKRHDIDGTAFPARDDCGNEIKVCLDGDAYGLHTPGTGDVVVREVE